MAKKIWAMYFSATGTTEKIVTCIADELAAREGGKAECYDFTLPQDTICAFRAYRAESP